MKNANPSPSFTPPENYSRADIHMHTNLGDGWASPERVIEESVRKGLRVIAITDHDHVEGAKRVADLLETTVSESGHLPTTAQGDRLRAQVLERQPYPLQLITGVEVSTRQGHLLGLFVNKAPKALRSVEESIEAIKEQGGLVIVPHPLGRLVPSLSRDKINELLEKGYPIDGIEIYNPSPANASMRSVVRTANSQWKLAEVGGSDAHFWQHIGAAYTLFPGNSAEDLRIAILERTVRSGGQEIPPARLPVGAYVAQCAWSWFVDPPRRVMRSLRER